MKPTQTRIADLWCKLMHKDPMWPSHGQYECRTCGRRHQVCWELPPPALQGTVVLPAQGKTRGPVRFTPRSIPQQVFTGKPRLALTLLSKSWINEVTFEPALCATCRRRNIGLHDWFAQ